MHSHAKTDSEVTSLAPSSPARTAYYVQSPSRDSHDGEKTTTSFQSTPVISPSGSPPHSHSSVGRHSRESSSSRFSSSLKPGSRKISPTDGKHHRKGQKQCDVIAEEGLLEDEESQKGPRRRCYVVAFVLAFVVLFSLFSLILLAASKPQKPKITMKSITFENLVIQAGSDHTGVATEMITMNSTVKFTYRNTGTFFGVHVSSTPLDLSYDQITIGSGTVKKFHQSRKSQRIVAVSVAGSKIPLYGSSSSLTSSMGTGTTAAAAATAKTSPVPLKLNFVVRTRANVLGKLVRPKFFKKIECSISFNSKKLNTPISLKNSCTYD